LSVKVLQLRKLCGPALTKWVGSPARRATSQWFASVNGFKDDALDAIKQVCQIPCRCFAGWLLFQPQM